MAARNQARQQGMQARDQSQTVFQKLKQRSPGPLGWIAILAAGAVLTTITVIALIVLTPIFIIFSPILVPLGIILALCAGGLITAVGTGLATVGAVYWLYKYFKGGHPPGADQMEQTMQRLHHKARDLGAEVKSKAQEAAPGA